MIPADLRATLRDLLQDRVRFDVPLARLTSLCVGGPAEAVATPSDRAELAALLGLCTAKRIPHYLIGNGFNTLATDAPDRLEIEIVVKTGADFTEPAPDGTLVVVETSISEVEDNGPITRTSTIGGHAVVRLVHHSDAAHTVVTARVDDVEAQLSVVVDEYGSMRLVS